MKYEKIDILDVLLDEDNTYPIYFPGKDGKKYEFEQVAVISLKVDGNDELYAILAPLDEIDGMKFENEAFVFLVDIDEEGNSFLRIEDREDIAIEVFDKYYQLLSEII